MGNSITAGVSKDTMFSILNYQNNSVDKIMDKDHFPLIVYRKMTSVTPVSIKYLRKVKV